MLQKFSYFNLFYAIAYVLIYFRDNTLNFSLGILMIVFFNWLSLRSHQHEHYKWSALQYISGLWSLYYIGYLLYGVINILKTVIIYNFASTDTLTFLVLSFTLIVGVFTQAILYFIKNLKAIKTG